MPHRASVEACSSRSATITISNASSREKGFETHPRDAAPLEGQRIKHESSCWIGDRPNRREVSDGSRPSEPEPAGAGDAVEEALVAALTAATAAGRFDVV